MIELLYICEPIWMILKFDICDLKVKRRLQHNIPGISDRIFYPNNL